MDAPIDTLNYMLAGFAVVFGGLLLYVLSLIWRTASVRRQAEWLDERDHED